MEETKPILENLWNERISADTYGSKDLYYEHIFEQYRIFVDKADEVSKRRDTANAFFLTLHTFLLGIAGLLYGKAGPVKNQWIYIFPLASVLALCYVWWRLLKSYRQLNKAKYEVIGEYERKLPSSPYWRAEWTALGEGRDPKIYKPLTDVEKWVPAIFAVVYIVMVIAISF